MENTMFRPAALAEDHDPVAQSLLNVARHILVVVFGLFPLMFIPVAYAPLLYTKVLFVLAGVAIAVIFYALAVLREGEVSITAPFALIAMWGITTAYIISTLLSGDLKDAFVGNGFEVHTTAFMILLAAIASVGLIFRGSKTAVVRLYGLLIASGIVLALYHILRILAGADTLSFGVFNSLTLSPLGSWNGLALYFGLIVLLALVALEQLPLTKLGKWVLACSSGLALIMLAIVNYFAVWAVIAVVSVIMLIYAIARKHYQRTEPMVKEQSNGQLASITFAAATLVISLMFILGSSTLATFIVSHTGVEYIEVRPSFSATVDMARYVYNESPIFGVGPNQFVDVWRMYKDPSLNETMFWNTNFESGSGFIPTAFVTTGVLGLIAWVSFLSLLVFSGFRMIFRTSSADRFWTFIGHSSFIAAAYLWGMSFIYTPSATILMLAAVCTGIFFAAYGVLMPQSRPVVLSVAGSRAYGVVFVGIVVLVIFGSVGTLYATGRHYSALYEFNRAFATLDDTDTIDSLQERIMGAYALSQNDIFVRRIAEYRLAQIEAMLSVAEPTDAEIETFQGAVADGVSAAETATELDPSEPLNWLVLGRIYSALAQAGIADAYERAGAAFDRARALSPTNPAIALLRAQLEARAEDVASARTYAEEAVRMKRNFTEALLFLSQLDILENNVASAIERTESIISIEPNNPARYYQLGILESATGDIASAIAAFERAVALDPQYANARYFLALAYVEDGRTDDALRELAVVAELNPDNQELAALIDQIESGASVIGESGTVLEDGSDITQSDLSETSLVAPVGTVPAEGAAE